MLVPASVGDLSINNTIVDGMITFEDTIRFEQGWVGQYDAERQTIVKLERLMEENNDSWLASLLTPMPKAEEREEDSIEPDDAPTEDQSEPTSQQIFRPINHIQLQTIHRSPDQIELNDPDEWSEYPAYFVKYDNQDYAVYADKMILYGQFHNRVWMMSSANYLP